MAKPNAGKHVSKNTDETGAGQSAAKATATQSNTAGENTQAETTSKPSDTSKSSDIAATSSGKKESSPSRTKKQSPAKNGSILPSAYKLEQLKAAVSAAGGAEQLLVILNYVEEAGGRAEVVESIEAYRVLKTVLDE